MADEQRADATHREPFLKPLRTSTTTESPGTMTEALADIRLQQDQIKQALDRMIADATALRARL